MTVVNKDPFRSAEAGLFTSNNANQADYLCLERKRGQAYGPADCLAEIEQLIRSADVTAN